ncbi:MAG: phosphoribosylformylglycinamidine synthase [Oscillospiraceae bacterium]|nr:phosphoribosylformylglycinamidine synthase [Oscillospiraceae bacterium]
MVYRIYVEKKPGQDQEARALENDLRKLLELEGISRVRILNRYDAEGLSEELFRYAVRTVFSEPQLDHTYGTLEDAGLSVGEDSSAQVLSQTGEEATAVFAVEYLPGQFDQRADSAAQCIQILSQGNRPTVRSAKVYALYGTLSADELDEIKKYVINPVEAREAAIELPTTLETEYEIPSAVKTVENFRNFDDNARARFLKEMGLAMDEADLKCTQEYFRNEGRDPTVTEIRVLDTYWSDHCRHTTFHTILDRVSFEDTRTEAAWQRYLQTRKMLGREAKPVCLMDLGTIAAKALKAEGKLRKLDESEEINACTVKIQVERTETGAADASPRKEDWLLLFKNETHNHPTEIEPFGGAATCIGGAIRDPLSGRAYVYGAMRVTGAADPLKPIRETLPGKLPQRKICTGAAAGYSSYGNQIGLATGIVDELYHPGYAAKRMEIGAVVAAAPAENVKREQPAPGDVVILLGGSTGRDGIGGATGSSKAHDAHSVETCGAEVQKGNAPEERKLQRLFRNPAAAKMIRRCNDFGAGGVSVAIGELADGLKIHLNAVPKKYEGLDGTELAISESQERMAVVVAAEDAGAFLQLAASENLQAVPVAEVQAEPRLVMDWNGATIVDLSRAFLDTNGAEKHTDAVCMAYDPAPGKEADDLKDYLPLPADGANTFAGRMCAMAESLQCCSRQGLSDRFDSTIGAGSVLMPYGGLNQKSPVQAMVQKIPVEHGDTETCSFMSWGFDPMVSAKSPFRGAYLAVVESVSKLVATGAEFEDVYLSFQEYFERLGRDSRRWGVPLSALLGAFEAQLDLGVAAIGGKDSMSGSFEDLDVPPTLVSFAVTTGKISEVVSPEFKEAGHRVVRLSPRNGGDGLPDAESLKSVFSQVTALQRSGSCTACYTPGPGGTAEAVMKMCFGNSLGFCFEDGLDPDELFRRDCGSFVLELTGDVPAPATDVQMDVLGAVTNDGFISFGEDRVSVRALLSLSEAKLEPVYPSEVEQDCGVLHDFVWNQTGARLAPAVRTAKPRVLIPAFPGTNCEIDSARAVTAAGGIPEIFVVRNLSSDDIARSVEEFAARLKDSQMVFLPGGFSGGDEPDGSGKFITAFFRAQAVKDGITDLLERRDGLMCGICNGFQALIKLGLVPYGRIIDTDADCPTLTFNRIARHQSRIVRTRIASNKSPWLALTEVGQVFHVPISHGEGRFLADDALVRKLAENGQIATQYVDLNGNASADVQDNPNGSAAAIEGITSPDGRVFGKMGHAERVGNGLYLNVPGDYNLCMFEAAVQYFR